MSIIAGKSDIIGCKAVSYTLYGVGLLVKDERIFLTVFAGTLTDTIVIHHGVSTAVHVTALLPVKGSGNIHLIEVEVGGEAKGEVKGMARAVVSIAEKLGCSIDEAIDMLNISDDMKKEVLRFVNEHLKN